MQHWNAVDRFPVEMATDDLDKRGEAHPLLIAFTGDRLTFFAFLRWFPKGEYADPMIELLSLAMALGTDRLAFSITGRLTSLQDPLPPVTADGDLRQRALVVAVVDGTHAPLRQHSVIHPFELVGRRVMWSEPLRLTGGQGWIADALRLCVERRRDLAGHATNADIRAQAARCAELGHDLFLGAAVQERLGSSDGARS